MNPHIPAVTSVALGLLLSTPSPSLAQQRPQAPTRLEFATLAPEGTVYGRLLADFAADVRQRTGGQLTIRIYWNGVRGEEGEMVRAVHDGRLGGAAVTGVGLYAAAPSSLVFQAPGMFESYEEYDRAWGCAGNELRGFFLHNGFEVVALGETGIVRPFSVAPLQMHGQIWHNERAWRWIDDPIGPEIFRIINVTTVPLGVGDVARHLSTREVTVLFGTPTAVVAMGWAPYLHSMADLEVLYGTGGLIVRHGTLDALPANLRRSLQDAAANFEVRSRSVIRAADANAILAMRRRGVTVQQTASARDIWRHLFDLARLNLTGTPNGFDAGFYNRVRAWARNGCSSPAQ